MKRPRDYQSWAHSATWNYLHNPENYGKNPLVVMATGLGKSLNMAMLQWHLLTAYPHVRIMSLAHVKELVQGNYRELLGLWPSAPAGVYASGLNARDTRAQVTFAMINSVAKRAATFGHIDFVFVDEAHRLSDNDATLYGRLLADLRKKNPNLIMIGYTATDYRMKGGLLTDMGLFDDVVYDIGGGESFIWAVQQGYLILPVPTDPGFQLDDSGIAMQGGDYKNSDASNAMHEQDIIERAVDYAIEIARTEGRKHSLTFAQSIEDAELIAEMFTYKGFETHAVHSKRNDRDEILEFHKKGGCWGITNKDILTTGYNDPALDLLVNLRLTRSPGLWVQMVGRMTRPIWLPGYDITTVEGRLASIAASGKTNARVLDFTGNTERLGPINYPHVPGKRKKGGGDAPVRKCGPTNTYDHYEGDHNFPHCEPTTYHHTSVKVCPHCGYQWPKGSNLRVEASKAELVSATNPLGLDVPKAEPKQYEVFSVHQMTLTHHHGRKTKDEAGNVLTSKPDSVKVSYRCGTHTFNTWVCLEHGPGSFPRRKAEEWWEQHGGAMPAPTSVADTMEMHEELDKPLFIKVWINTKYPEIVAYDFQGTRFEEPDLTNLMAPPKLYEPEPDPLEDFHRYGGGGGNGWMDDEIPF